ncbi:MAG: TetR/AcrR family transcriptional regulator [Coriobacteriia bacterium]|nr:TetR/AcrR family transcriptional regulator [Coriobacteriia bacterium]
MGMEQLIDGALSASLLRLLEERPITKITVQDITDGAGLNKRTFYNHFQDKNDLVAFVWNQAFEAAWHDGDRRCTLEEYFANMSAWAIRMPTFFVNTIGYYSGQNNLWETICQTSKEGVLRLIEWNGRADEITPEVVQTVDFYVHGCLFRGNRPQQEIAREREIDPAELFSPQRMIELIPDSIKPLLLEPREG